MAPASSNVTTVTELDLSACQSGGIVDRINAVPGLKTSAGEFFFFRFYLFLFFLYYLAKIFCVAWISRSIHNPPP